MIKVKVESRRAERCLLSIAGAYPKQTRRALGRYGGIIRRRLVKSMKAAMGVPMSEIRNVLHPGIAGGKLANSKSLKLYRPSRYEVVVDWIEPLRSYASRWQSGGDVGFGTREVRHAMYRVLGGKGHRVAKLDPSARQPSRLVSLNERSIAAREAPRVILGIVKSILAKESAKNG